MIGSGPFVLESYTMNQSTVLAKRAGYDWGSSLWTHPGEAYLDELEFRVVPESGVRTAACSPARSTRSAASARRTRRR